MNYIYLIDIFYFEIIIHNTNQIASIDFILKLKLPLLSQDLNLIKNILNNQKLNWINNIFFRIEAKNEIANKWNQINKNF